MRNGTFPRERNVEREGRGRLQTEAILDPHPEVCWCWRRKRERELMFVEAKFRSGNGVGKTDMTQALSQQGQTCPWMSRMRVCATPTDPSCKRRSEQARGTSIELEGITA